MRVMFRFGLFLHTAFLFVIAQLVALVVARDLFSLGFTLGIPSGEGITLLQFLLLFFSLTLFLFILFRLYRGQGVYRAIFMAIVFFGLLKLFEVVFPTLLSMIVALVFVSGLFLLPMVWMHDLIVILAAAGIGPIFGLQMSWQTSIWIMIVLSVYDVISVFITRHMIAHEHEMAISHASFSIIVPERWRDIRLSLSRVRPGSGFLLLGGGDVIIPMLFTTSLFLVRHAYAYAAIGGMVAGLFANHCWLMATRKPLPALPFIAFGAILGLFFGIYL